MMKQAALVATLACALPTLAACIPTPDVADASSGSNTEACNSKPVERYIGKRFTAVLAEQMRKEAGATLLRTLAEGSPMTMDYRIERLNVIYDEAMLITIVNCG
jgi:hypothetical protein